MVPAVRTTLRRPLTVGFLPLTDAAPLVVAQERGLFLRHGVSVLLRREVGWATVRDKLLFGELDAAHALAPMLWSAALGLGGARGDVLTACILNLNGNAITLARTLHDEGASDPAALRALARARRGERKLTLGVVFSHSSHHLLLRNWLRAAGLEPERDVRIVVVPPAQVVRNLAAGTLDGFCAGEPWNSLAVAQGLGWCPAWSAALAPGHVEKVLMVTRAFAERRPAEHAALIAALTEAAAWCDEPQNRRPLAELLAQPAYLNQPVEVLAPALEGVFDTGIGREPAPDFFVFNRGEANVPTAERARCLQRDLVAAGLVPTAAAVTDLPARLFREDLHRAALATASLTR